MSPPLQVSIKQTYNHFRLLPNAKTMTLVALTGYGQETDKQRAFSAGFDEHLTKPVKIERLQAVLNRPR
ncbi:hypothetical protein [Candidatus Binatus sp.]|uniref:hypothetical protein n=1 Tax=Candidatus Binatus sp. TaxID=2811406 RepID=UPI003CC6C16D